MTRKEVYEKCVESGVGTAKELEAIDAIIDCAVEEAIERIKNTPFATIGGRTWPLTTKSKYIERREQE